VANGGTLFLDGIGELPLSAQSKLLHVLQNSEIQALGQDTTETVDVRTLQPLTETFLRKWRKAVLEQIYIIC
jgi:transcriptional regulator with GAF, ATPase, and Fis domain